MPCPRRLLVLTIFLCSTAAQADYGSHIGTLSDSSLDKARKFTMEHPACGCQLLDVQDDPEKPPFYQVNCSSCASSDCQRAFHDFFARELSLQGDERFPLGALEGNNAALSEPAIAACIPVVNGTQWSWADPSLFSVEANGLTELYCLARVMKLSEEASDHSLLLPERRGGAFNACGVLSSDSAALSAAYSQDPRRNVIEKQKKANTFWPRIAVRNSCCESRLGFGPAQQESCVDQQMHNINPQYKTSRSRLLGLIDRSSTALLLVQGCKEEKTITDDLEASLKRLDAQMKPAYVDGLRARQSQAAKAVANHPVIDIPLRAGAVPPPVAGNIFDSSGDSAGERILCDSASQAKYLEEARLPRLERNVPRIIDGQQRLYFCRVNQFYGKSNQAVLLSRLGLRAARALKAMSNPLMACGVIQSELAAALKDVLRLQREDKSSELQMLATDFTGLKTKDCSELVVLDSDRAAQESYLRHFCSWKTAVEKAQEGSTLGFSYKLAPCGLVH